MSNWKSLRSQFPEDQQCIIKGEQCEGDAAELHHGLHGRRDGNPEIKHHVDVILNAVPSCHNCNFLRDADNDHEKSFDYLVDKFGIQALTTWASQFPENVKRPGTEWNEMINRLLDYRE